MVTPEIIRAGEAALTASLGVWNARSARPEDVLSKGRQDPVSALDRALEAAIRSALESTAPVLGEESPPPDDLAGALWVVDPLDGTFNYVHGIAPSAVSIAYMEGGAPAAAWVHDLAAGETFRAVRGEGATLDGVPLSVDGATDAALGVSSDVLAHPEVCTSIAREFGKVRVIGSQALQLCWVGAGRLCGTVNPRARIWDDAAASLVVTEAGAWYGSVGGELLFPLAHDDPRMSGAPLLSAAARDSVRERLLGVFAPLGR